MSEKAPQTLSKASEQRQLLDTTQKPAPITNARNLTTERVMMKTKID
jgi:hypothetical protein